MTSCWRHQHLQPQDVTHVRYGSMATSSSQIDYGRFTPPNQAPFIPIRSPWPPLSFAPKSPLRDAPRLSDFLAGAPQRRCRISSIPDNLVSPCRQFLALSPPNVYAHPLMRPLEFFPQQIDVPVLDPKVNSAAAPPFEPRRRYRKYKTTPRPPSSSRRFGAPRGHLPRAQGPRERRVHPRPSRAPPSPWSPAARHRHSRTPPSSSTSPSSPPCLAARRHPLPESGAPPERRGRPRPGPPPPSEPSPTTTAPPVVNPSPRTVGSPFNSQD